MFRYLYHVKFVFAANNRKIMTTMVQKTTLSNGLRIVTERIDNVESAAIGIDVLVGSRDELEATRGISHVIEHMLFKGTKEQNQFDLSKAWEMLGGSNNAYTSQERTLYYGSVLAEFYMDALSLLSDMFLHAHIPATELETEKGVILREIEMREDHPEGLAFELFGNQFWPNHNLGQDIIGCADTVSSFTRDDLVQYKDSKYTPDVIVVSATGKVDHDKIVEYVEREFSGLTGTRSDWRIPNNDAAPAIFDVKIERPVQLSHVIVGYPAFNRYDLKRWPAMIVSGILGNGTASRLWQEIREKRGLAYSVCAETETYAEGGVFYAYAGTEAKSVPQVADLIDEVLKQVCDTLIDPDELLRIQRTIYSSSVMAHERMSARMQHNSKTELFYDRHVTIKELLEHINAVTAQDVQSVAQEMFDPSKKATLTLGPIL